MLTEVIQNLAWKEMTAHELSTHIISGLYKAMRNEETPKPVLVLAACEVLTARVNDGKELVVYNNGSLGQIVVDFKGDSPSSGISGGLAGALIEFADDIG